MQLSRVRNLLMVISGVVLFSFLFIQAQAIDFTQHNRYVFTLRRLNELDTRINQNILASRYGLLTHYDSVVNDLNDLQSLQKSLYKIPNFVNKQNQRSVQQILQEHMKLLSQKTQFIEDFKSRNSILRNSLAYFPIAVDKAVNKVSVESGNNELVARLNSLLGDVLVYNLSSNEILRPKITEQILSIRKSKQQLPASLNQADIDIVINHAEIILQYQASVNNLVGQILVIPTAQRAELLFQTYANSYQQALKRANIYRFLLFLLSLALVGSISAYIIYKLRKSAAIIQRAEEKYRSIFENSVEGIFQTTLDGRYLSANPSLVRLYGYESIEELCTSFTDIGRQLYVLPDRRSKFIRLIDEQGSVSNFESQVYRKDGSMIWVSETARAVRDRTGNLLFYEGTVADITARKQAEEALRVEQEKAELLLLNILPKPIADRLKQNPQSIADSFADVTVLFADLVNFTGLSEQISPTELVVRLNLIFSAFDVLAEKHGLEKIKTIGDAYMVVGGLPMPRPDHAEAIAAMGLDILSEIARFNAEYNQALNIRIGINTGPVVAGVIGIKKFIYDLWGDTVNTAARMESHGVPGCIQVTEETYQRLQHQYLFEQRGLIPVKGKGEMMTYFLIGRMNQNTNTLIVQAEESDR
jgi:PAS domain S-box-containing protein